MIVTALLLAASAVGANLQSRDTAIALTNVTIVDPSNATAIPGQTIVISDGLIRAVGSSRSMIVPRGAQRVNGAGKFVIPGLWDSHVHFMNTGPSALPLYVALGVTSVREMGGFIDSTRAWQARMAAGTLVGPRILTPGPILESPRYLDNVRARSVRDPRIGQRVLPYRLSVGDTADARRAIDSLVALKVDFVKIRTTATPESYFAILRSARRAGLKVAGHQPSVATLATVADSGQDDIEHAFAPPLSQLGAASRDSIYKRFALRGTWYTPTLVVSKVVTMTADSAARAIFSDDAIRTDPRRAYASPWLLGWWRMQVDERIPDTASKAPVVEAYSSSLSDVRAMRDAGVRLLAGTDAGSVLVYPGFSLHEELRLLVEDAGLTPREALLSATLRPAQFAGLEARLGTINAGMIADLVVLDANPLLDIKNTRRIDSVVKGGKLYPRAELDAMLTAVRAAVKP